MPQQTRALRKIVLANVALIRPYTGVREHVLIVIADGRKRLLAQHTRGDVGPTVLEALVTHELARTAVLLAALLAFEALLVQHQVIVQSASVMKLFPAQVTRILVLDLTIALLVPPLVTLHVLHLLAAEAADLQLRHVSSLHVVRQIDLQFVTATAMLADEARLVLAVRANIMPLQTVPALVFHVADLALEEVVRSMYPLVLLQCSQRVASSLAPVALERFAVHVSHVSLDFPRVIESLLAEWTRILDFVQSFVHFGGRFLESRARRAQFSRRSHVRGEFYVARSARLFRRLRRAR